jgi:hypothetical protein
VKVSATPADDSRGIAEEEAPVLHAFVSPEIYYGALCLITLAASMLFATIECRGGFLLDRDEAKWPRT